MPASIDYPSEVLPAPLINSYKYNVTNPYIDSEMDSGFSRRRKRFTKSPVTFNISLNLDQSSLSFFEAWIKTTLNGGSEWFNMSLSNGSGPATAHEVRFVDYPTIEYAEGVMTKVTAKLLGVEQIVTGIAYTETVIGLIGSLGGIRGFDTASNNLNKFDTALHVTYPSSGYGPAA